MIRIFAKGVRRLPDNKTKKEILDDFWDISSLVPPRKHLRPSSKSVSTVEIIDGSENSEKQTERSTVISRFIPPHCASERTPPKEPELSYAPESSLVHKVTLYKDSTSYEFYADFCDTARKLWGVSGRECEYVDFFSYSPQYDQLSHAQLAYYLWWRESFRQGRCIKTNTCYIYLYTFELINAYDMTTPEAAREIMISILENYSGVLKGVIPRYIRWISDFSLIHRLAPPKHFSEQLLKNAGAFKEYFVRVPGNTPDGWARTLLDYCCSYDYRTSKFATGDDLVLYDTHVPRALTKAVEFLSSKGRILSELPFGDCRISAKAFEGAVCSSANRYTIEAEYCSFSRSHELKILITDVVKYTENRIRQALGIRSRLSVYALPTSVRSWIDEYLASVLPARERGALPQKEMSRPDYEKQYDTPHKPISFAAAEEIERRSWDTTRRLVEAFEEDGEREKSIRSEAPWGETENPLQEKALQPVPIAFSEENGGTLEQTDVWSPYRAFLRAVRKGDSAAQRAEAKAQGILSEVLADRINELAADAFGDVLLEETDGGYAVIEDYAELLDQLINEKEAF